MKKRKLHFVLLLPSLLPILSLYLIPTPRKRCLSYIAYDYPAPSPATPINLQSFLKHTNRPFINCEQNCTDLIKKMCTGTHPPISLAGRLGPQSSCLKSFMYFITTTQPPPAYYNHRESYEAFQRHARHQDCRLLHHYDERGVACADDFDVHDRVLNISNRFDEVHDLANGGGDIGEVLWRNVSVRSMERRIGDVAFLRAEQFLRKTLMKVNSGRELCY